MGLKRTVAVVAAAGVGYLAWQKWKEMEKGSAPAADGAGRNLPYTPAPAPPAPPPRRETTPDADLGPPSPDQVAGYKIRFNSALEDERLEDAAHIVGVLRGAGEEAWATNAAQMVKERRRSR